MAKFRNLLLIILTALTYPGFAKAQEGLVGSLIICNQSEEAIGQDIDARCDFRDLIVLANKIFDLLFYLALAISVVILMVIGAKYLFAGSSNQVKEAKESFKKLAIGFGLILGAYLIVNTLFILAGVNPEFNYLN